MITAIDTNILVDVFANTGESSRQAIEALLLAADQGDLLLSVICYAEIAHRFITKRELERTLQSLGITVSPIQEEHAFAAGKFFEDYRKRGGKRERILPDFLVGAHALLEADRLLTTDGRFYGPGFPHLKAVSPKELLAKHSG